MCQGKTTDTRLSCKKKKALGLLYSVLIGQTHQQNALFIMTPTADLGSLCFAWLQPYCVAEICPQTGLPCVTMTHAKHTGINKSQVVIADNRWTAEEEHFTY